MTNLSALIAELQQNHITLQTINGQLKVEAPKEVLTEQLRQTITEHKAELLAYLTAQTTASPASNDPTGKLLSYAQQRLWFMTQLHPEKALYHINHAYTLTGNLNQKALQIALEQLLIRHEILRSTISVIENEPKLVLQTYYQLTIQYHDLSRLAEDEQPVALTAAMQALLCTPFNLESEIPFRVGLFSLASRKHVLLIVMHHIATDGWSNGILRRDLSQLYSTANSGIPHNLPKLTLQYSDYAIWQRQWLQGDMLAKHLSFWRKELEDLNPALNLPTDFPRPATSAYQAGEWSQNLDATLCTALRDFSKTNNVTLFMTLIVAFQVLFYRFSEQIDFALATPIANRQRQDLENLVGFFVNTLLIRSSINVEDNFLTLLQATRKRTISTLNYPYLPFDRLVQELNPERKQDQTPLAQIFIAMQNLPSRKNDWGDLQVEPRKIPAASISFDLEIYIREENGQLRLTWLYRQDLWSEHTLQHWGDCFHTLLSQSIKTPACNIRQLPLLNPAMQRQLLQQWSFGRAQPLNNRCVPQLFEQQAQQTPDAIALCFETQTVTYRELNEWSNQLAHYILDQGINIEAPIALCLERSVEMIICLLGILKAGCAYVPLNPDTPKIRLNLMLTDTQPALLITRQHLAEHLADFNGNSLIIDTDWHNVIKHPASNPNRAVSLKNLAYIMYTSGSTGQPKGVIIEHFALSNFLQAMQKEVFHPKPGHQCLNITPLTFDIAALEIYLPLISGASVVMINTATAKDAEKLKHFIASRPIDLMQATPTTYQLLSLVGWVPHDGLTMLCGGEKLSNALAQVLCKPATTVWNLYGPTETTIWSTAHCVNDAQRTIPVGKPIANTEVYILDQQLQPVPLGVWGELTIGGFGLARGYLNNAALTQERFIAHPFSKNPAARLYKTGDRVRWLHDGTIEFAERFDRQVKIRGHRIELGEIETLLTQHPHIKQAVVTVAQDTYDNKLIAYCITENEPPAEQQLRLELKLLLPDYMIPQRLITVTSLPLTPNGKLDLKALSAHQTEPQPQLVANSTSLSNTEAKLITLWSEILKPGHPICVSDNFFDLGGTSLASIQVLSAIENTFTCHIPLATLFQWTTIAELGVFLDTLLNNTSPAPAMADEIHATPLESTLYRKLLGLAIGRKEPRLHAQSLIYQLSVPSNAPALYLCGADKELAAHCNTYQVFGLDTAFGLMPLTPENIQALARQYVNEILAHDPEGPYRIGGYCIGGRIAYAMAKQLQALGKTVSILLLIDQLLYQPYDGNIAFFILQQNNLLRDLQQPGSAKILRKYFPHGWTVDVIPGQHTTVMQYFSAMVLSERISTRATHSHIKPLVRTAYHVEWQLLHLEQDDTSATLTLRLKNSSAVNWSAGQIAIGHHWQDLQGVLIAWAADTMSINDTIPMGQSKTLQYTLTKPADNSNVFVIIDLLDKGNTWFSLSGGASYRTLINVSLPTDATVTDLQPLYALHTQGKLQTVIPLYQQALNTHPEQQWELSLKLAQAFMQAGRSESTQSVLLQALAQTGTPEQKNPHHLLLAEIYLNAAAFESAITEARQVLAQQENNTQALSILGLAHAQQGHFTAAQQAFDQAIAYFTEQQLPTRLISQLEKFNFLLDKNNLADTLKYAQILLDKDPLNPFHSFNYAYFLFRRKHFKEAENMLLQALDIFPAQPTFYRNLAKLYLEQDDLTAAAAIYRQLTRLLPLKIENFVMLAKTRLQQQQYQAALDVLEQASKLNAEDASVQRCKAEINKARHEKSRTNTGKFITKKML